MRTLHYQFKNVNTDETFEVDSYDERNALVNNSDFEYIGIIFHEVKDIFKFNSDHGFTIMEN